MEGELILGRNCGTCNVCCVVPSINDPDMQKLPGYRCRNARSDATCAIYATRPQTCRGFFCGWRRLEWIAPELKPDTSGVFVRLSRDPALVKGRQPLALTFTLLRRGSLKAEGLAEAIATAVRAGYSTYLIVPGPPGNTSCRVQLDNVLIELVRESEPGALLRAVAAYYAEAVNALPQTRPMTMTGSDGAAPGDLVNREELAQAGLPLVPNAGLP